MTLAPISHRIVVDAPPDVAFEVFAAGLGEWWPLAYTVSGVEFDDARVEPRVGGRWVEADRSGEERPWGDVRAYEPGRRLVLGYAMGADRKPTPPARASEVEVRFQPDGADRALVVLEHRGFERHGDGAQLRAAMDSPLGWPVILAELRRGIRRVRVGT